MIDYGIIIKNKTNQIVIDSTYRNYSYQGGGYKTCSAAYSSGESIQTITSTTNAIVACMKPPSDYARIVGFTESGSSYTGIRFLSKSAQNVYYKYYTEGLKNSISGYGMQVLNSSGTTVWSSTEDSYFNIVSAGSWNVDTESQSGAGCAINGAAYYTPSATYDITVEDADNNYFFFSGFEYAYSNCPESSKYSWRYMVGMKYVNSTTIRLGYFYYDVQSYTGTSYTANSTSVDPKYYMEIKPPA